MTDSVELEPGARRRGNRSTRRPAGRTRRVVRAAAAAMGVGSTLVAAAGVVTFHYRGQASNLMALTASFAPILILVGVLGPPALVAAGARRLAAISLAVVIAGAWTQAPLFVSNRPVFDEADAVPSITVLSANIELGDGDAASLVEQVRSADADILVVVELTDAAIDRLREAGLEDLLPEHYLSAQPSGGGGTGIYSRLPLSDTQPLGNFSMANLTADVELAPQRTMTLVAVHPIPPYPSASWKWSTEMDKVRTLIDRRSDPQSPTVVIGDFNSTWNHSRYRDLLTDGFQDAADQVGAGWLPTYPADRWFGPLIGIDRLITRNAVVDDFGDFPIVDSDHRGIAATITPYFP